MKDAYDYKILKNIDSDDLAKDVVKSFREGWEPIGGVSMITARLNNEAKYEKDGEILLVYAQALVKR
ncbi:DUF1737 domain-containing protein [Chitinophagaceae bacterium LB-8]|uniref:DUF1737 domain-containing protein n=1 Tax=Paraflavisolibacter caeni TaxID=2982496 RepID=A0A9X2XV04_9BACT|nr:DUF1737 domain-containing protein [Paraflavisolibacter caeni]MCU7549420.1 DUF1737 domain-containing protein [Paraflavisolibacter caeni]